MGAPLTLLTAALQKAAPLSALTSSAAAARESRSCLQASCTAAQVASEPVDDHVGPAGAHQVRQWAQTAALGGLLTSGKRRL